MCRESELGALEGTSSAYFFEYFIVVWDQLPQPCLFLARSRLSAATEIMRAGFPSSQFVRS